MDVWVGETVSYWNGRETGRNEVRDECVLNTSCMTANQYIRPYNAIACCSAKIYRKNVIGTVRFDVKRSMGEDVIFSFLVVTKPNLLISFRKLAVYNYRIVSTGLHMKLDANRIKNFIEYSNFMLHVFDMEGSVTPEEIYLWKDYQSKLIMISLKSIQKSIIYHTKGIKNKNKQLREIVSNKEIFMMAQKGGIKYRIPFLWVIDECWCTLGRGIAKIYRIIKNINFGTRRVNR